LEEDEKGEVTSRTLERRPEVMALREKDAKKMEETVLRRQIKIERAQADLGEKLKKKLSILETMKPFYAMAEPPKKKEKKGKDGSFFGI